MQIDKNNVLVTYIGKESRASLLVAPNCPVIDKRGVVVGINELPEFIEDYTNFAMRMDDSWLVTSNYAWIELVKQKSNGRFSCLYTTRPSMWLAFNKSESNETLFFVCNYRRGLLSEFAQPAHMPCSVDNESILHAPGPSIVDQCVLIPRAADMFKSSETIRAALIPPALQDAVI